MIKALIASTVFASVFFLVDAWYHQKRKFGYYLLIFMFLMILNLLYPHQAHASHVKSRELTHVQKIDFRALRDESKANAERTYNEAKDRCWYLPEVSDRLMARHCFEVSLASLAPGSAQSRLVYMILAAIGEYSWYCWEEMEYIEYKLKWSEYHWEMYEFYCDVLDKG